MTTPTAFDRPGSLPMLELANVDFVTEFLAVGGDLAYDDDLACQQAIEIVDVGITHVLDVRQECDETELWSRVPEITYRWEGIDDAGQRVPAAWFEDVTSWAEEAILAGGVVLTHCHMGVNRGPSVGYAVLLRLAWDPVEALAAIRVARPVAAIAYAGDALTWHLRRTGATAPERATQRRRVATWQRENPLDVVRVIRSIREAEES